MLNNAVDFILQPVNSLSNIYNSNDKIKLIDSELKNLKEYEQNYPSISMETKSKINDFVLNELKLNLNDKLSFMVHSSLDDLGSALTFGSVSFPSGGIVLISSEFLNRIEMNFDNEVKFRIAHEIGHIVNDDYYHQFIESSLKVNYLQFAVYVASTALLAKVKDRSISAHLVGCSVSKVVKECYLNTLAYEKELKADRFAAGISPQIASGGIKYLSEQLKESTEAMQSYQQELTESKSLWEKITSKVESIKVRLLYNEEGVYRLDPHPKFSSRLENLFSYLSNKSEQINQSYISESREKLSPLLKFEKTHSFSSNPLKRKSI